MKKPTPKERKAAAGKMSDVLPCLCRFGVPMVRGQGTDKRRKFGMVFWLSCMQCGRNAEGGTPAETITNWNEKCGEKKKVKS